jgi:short-subunit dehydrogenase
VAFSEVLYHENRGKGVRIIAVCPPPVATPLLEQATSKPKVLAEFGKPIPPEKVLAAIEAGLESGKFFVFPGFGTTLGVRLRRFLPRLLWAQSHRVEGI